MIAILFILIVFNLGYSQNTPKSFAYLNVLELEKEYVYLHYNKNISRVLTDHEIRYRSKEVLITQIDTKTKINYYIEYSPGPSADPSFIIKQKMKDGEKKIIKILRSCTEIYIPGNGNIYISGHSNNMFNKMRKYTLTANVINEVKQPYYYVGLNTETTKSIKIFSSKRLENVVASLPKNSPIEVVINEDEFYLIKTSFGLIGWVKIPECIISDTPIKGLYYAGD